MLVSGSDINPVLLFEDLAESVKASTKSRTDGQYK